MGTNTILVVGPRRRLSRSLKPAAALISGSALLRSFADTTHECDPQSKLCTLIAGTGSIFLLLLYTAK